MLNKQQHKEFKDYCQLNEIEDIDNFVVKCAKDGLTLDKYGNILSYFCSCSYWYTRVTCSAGRF